MAIAEASDIRKVWTHLGPWIKGYGIEIDVTAVVTGDEFAAMWPGVKAIADLDEHLIICVASWSSRQNHHRWVA